MDLSGRVVSLQLTAEGVGTLREALPDGGPFQAFIMDSDATGVWVLQGNASGEGPSLSFPVVLVKWNYIAALFLDFKLPGSPARRSGIGFRPLSKES